MASWNWSRTVLSVLLLFFSASTRAQQSPTPPWLVAVEAQDGQTKEYAGGIIVRADGLVATPWEFVAGAEKIKIGIPRFGILDAAEVYAASRGKGLVILKLKNAPAGLTPALLADDLPVAGDPLPLIGMANAARGVPFQAVGKLSYTVTGEQLLDSFGTLKPSGVGFDRDSVWLRTTLLYSPALSGAAIMRDATNAKVTAMVIPSITPKDSFANGVHAYHIQELLLNPLNPPQPLGQLHKHVDEAPRHVAATQIVLSDTLWDRGLSLVDRGTKFKERKKLLDDALAAADDTDVDLKKQMGPLKGLMGKLKSRATAIEQEIKKARPEGVVPSYQRPVAPNEIRGKDKDKNKNQTVTVPGFVLWSPEVIAAARQLTAEYQSLAAEWETLNRQLTALEAEQALTNFERDLREKMSRKHPQHLLETADVAGFRPAAEHQAAIAAYTADLAERPLAGARLLARSWSHLHLGQLAEAEADLLAAAKSADVNKAVGSASFARLRFRQGKTAEGEAQLARAEPLAKGNALALQILGLIACERGRLEEAVQHFEQSFTAPGDPTESHRLAALVYAAGPANVRDQARAAEHALRACQLTHRRDEGALLALGAALAEASNFIAAEKAAAEAEALAEPDLVPLCQTWRGEFKRSQPIRDVWPAKNP